MTEDRYNVVVIGSGPGGYVCALRAAQLGLKVALVERSAHVGGTCLNVGCIPSKALLRSSELFQLASHGESHGIVTDKLELDLSKMMERKDKVVAQLRKGVSGLLDGRGVKLFNGTGSFKEQGLVEVQGEETHHTLETDHVVIATGSAPVELPFIPFDRKQVVSSDEAIALAEVPKRLVVIGGGAIGLELGCVWSRLGSEVTIVEFLPNIAGAADDDVSRLAARIFKKQGLKIDTETKVTDSEIKDGVVQLRAERKGKEVQYEAEVVLVSVGRKPLTTGLNLEAIGLETDDKGRIPVKNGRTSVDGVWAIGDVTTGPMLAHKAEEEGVAVAEWIAGKPGHIDHRLVPNVIYTEPEIATVGLSEKAAKDAGIPVKVGKFPLSANGRAIAQDSTDGMAKIIAHEEEDTILGAAIIAAGASEMIASVVAHMTYGGSAEDLARTIHAHPTISESIKEASMAVDKWAIHSM